MIHTKENPDIDHQSHNHLHLFHKDFQLCKNLPLQELQNSNNQLSSHNQGIQDNCLFHRQDYPGKHHVNHNHLDQCHRDFQMCKNLLLYYSSSHIVNGNLVNFCNYQFRNCDLPCIRHHDHNLLHPLHMCCCQYNFQSCLNVIFF